MNNPVKQRKKFFANNLHRELFLIVFLAALAPFSITAIAVYYFIFTAVAEQIGFPEQITYILLPAAQKVINVLMIFTPISILVIVLVAHKITHALVGPFERIVRELDECLQGTREGYIVVRKGDKFRPLVDRINLMLDRIRKK